jgi:transcriptional regulator with XRE-family HTH domain
VENRNLQNYNTHKRLIRLTKRGLILGHVFSLRKSAMTNDPRNLFGLRLSEVRKSRGWSQQRLATASGLARSYVGGVERGQRNIALLNICKLAEALGLSPAALMRPPAKAVERPAKEIIGKDRSHKELLVDEQPARAA